MSQNDKKPPYDVGYGRPPKKTQFQKGQSGNLKGRPKRSKSFIGQFARELVRPVTIVENGRRRTIPKSQAIAMQIINGAAAGDRQTLKAYLQIMKEVGAIKLSVEQKNKPPLTMTLPKPPGQDRSYRYDADGKLTQLYPGVTMVEVETKE